jgi:hypothetical protein
MTRRKRIVNPNRKKQVRGFALLTPARRKQIAAMGAHAIQKRGLAYKFAPGEEAAKAGRNGGLARARQLLPGEGA